MTVGTLGVPAAAIVKKRMENGREGKNRKRGRVERGTGSKEEKRRAGGKETSLKGILNLTEGGIYPIMPYPGATSVAYLRNQSAVQIRRKEVTCLPDLYGFGLVGCQRSIVRNI